MSLLSPRWAILIANVLIPVAVIVFSTGFFPYKPLLPGLARFEGPDDAAVAPAVFDKVIFMVVDALRSDFVFSNSSGFSFTQSLIRSGAALPFTAHASSPTVTMPRLKAITTGSVPSFLDVILNIAESDTTSTLANQDTWLAQLKAKGGRLVMYGDDTWLKLFPDMFDRVDGTTSFFVSDFVEVDNNVTRHIPNELSNSDWSALIMHYLGLDHIGHKAGPNSPYMKSKQHEMDSIVTQIFTAMEQAEHLQSTLFVLCGDHGMNDAGNHGGSSAGETSPALVFISPKFQAKGLHQDCPVEPFDEMRYYHSVEQSDITPTIAGLLGLPIPLNSLGVFIPELLMMWDHGSQRIHILLENSKQLLRTVKATFPSYTFEPSSPPIGCDLGNLSDLDEIQCTWSQVSRILGEPEIASSHIESSLLRFAKAAQKVMSNTASNYDLTRLYLGLTVTGFIVLLAFWATYRLLSRSRLPGAFLMFIIMSYAGLMFASSYVEEEQQFWYWALTGWTVYLHMKSQGQSNRFSFPDFKRGSDNRSVLLLLANAGTVGLAISYRIMRRWNQTGQKFAAAPDIARNFFPSHQDVLWVLVILTYADTCGHLLLSLDPSLVTTLIAIAVPSTAFAFKIAFVASDSPELLADSFIFGFWDKMFPKLSIVSLARTVFAGIALLALLSISAWRRRKRASNMLFHEALNLFLITQSKATNIPLFLLFRIQLLILSTINLTGIEATITSLLSQYMTFFAFGGSNAISSVDLSSAYNGIGSYDVGLVGVLTFVSNWAGPIWWVSATQLLRSGQTQEERQNHAAVLTLHAAMALLSVMGACTALRTHLFIWTVFSPKYLYSLAWVIANHIGINLLGDASLAFLEGI